MLRIMNKAIISLLKYLLKWRIHRKFHRQLSWKEKSVPIIWENIGSCHIRWQKQKQSKKRSKMPSERDDTGNLRKIQRKLNWTLFWKVKSWWEKTILFLYPETNAKPQLSSQAWSPRFAQNRLFIYNFYREKTKILLIISSKLIILTWC